MRFSPPASLAAWLAGICVAEAQAQFLVDQLSFGYTGRINDKGLQTVPQFSIQGEPAVPELLSNKIILTQPSPGNARGAVWGDNPNKYKEWVADVDFRVNGPERGGGNLNIWLARRGVQEVGTASIYKVGRFDGLALVVDRSGGGAGTIRGFLNDGTTDYSSHHSVDSLAFGHCEYSYRNLGRPSQVKLRQTQSNFRVEIDGNLCFESSNIQIPPGYNFGLTAASAENPDSFEIFKFVVMTQDLNAKHEAPPQQPNNPDQQQQNTWTNGNGGAQEKKNVPVDEGGWEQDIADASADAISSSKAQFADLHNRLQSVNHHLSTIFRKVAAQDSIGEKRHAETSTSVNELKQLLEKLNKIDALQNHVVSLEREIKTIKQETANKVKDSENSLKKLFGTSHGDMLLHVAEKTQPAHGKLIFVIIGSQIVLVAAYIWYERKKTSPKKYL
ncbi:putative L-type lectin-like domain-containing protein [Seiridium cardinale]|uniref:L-type lectin-like domain-containing protein n=1 Tax=Seiridium cardinale TaxID=138064 RepID=A0ABR2XPF4_9PEZI